jgi:hypothetical protein
MEDSRVITTKHDRYALLNGCLVSRRDEICDLE